METAELLAQLNTQYGPENVKQEPLFNKTLSETDLDYKAYRFCYIDGAVKGHVDFSVRHEGEDSEVISIKGQKETQETPFGDMVDAFLDKQTFVRILSVNVNEAGTYADVRVVEIVLESGVKKADKFLYLKDGAVVMEDVA